MDVKLAVFTYKKSTDCTFHDSLFFITICFTYQNCVLQVVQCIFLALQSLALTTIGQLGPGQNLKAG